MVIEKLDVVKEIYKKKQATGSILKLNKRG